MNTRLFISGGSGFIGRNLTEYFSPRAKVFAPSRGALDLLDEDAVRGYLSLKRIQVVLHAAGVGGRRDTAGMRGVQDQNVRMFLNLARNLPGGARMIQFGSGAEYDIRFYAPKMDEDYFGVHVPEDEYGRSKYECSKIILARSFPVLGMRLFGVFGKYEPYHLRFISNAILKNILELPITIRQNTVYDYVYIADLMRIIEHFAFHGIPGTIYNVSSGDPIDLLSIARSINKIGGHECEIRVLHDGMGKEYSGANRRLMQELPDFRFTPIHEAIRELYRWYQANLKLIDMRILEEGDALLDHTRTGKAG